MIDLLLINPSYVDYGKKSLYRWNFYSLLEIMPPLGIIYIAANAIKAGYNVKFIDMEAEVISFKKLEKIVKKIKPKVAGIGCTSPLFSNVIELSKVIKSAINIPIIVGGPHTLIDYESIMEIKTIDYCIRGEGDFIVVPLLDYLLKDKVKIEEINSISYKKDGKVIHNKSAEVIQDLDQASFPARHLLRHNLYYHPFVKRNSCASIITARGCPFSCIFCFQTHKKVRRRSIGNVISEIRETITKYKIRDFEFFDETFNLDSQWVIDFCSELVKQGINIRWRARCRPELFTKEVAQAMKKARCYMISMGVESANNHTLKWLNKRYTIEQIKNAITVINQQGIGLHGYFILGSPVETKKDMLRTIDFACNSNFDFATFSILAPLPGTELFRMALKEGYLNNYDKNDYSDYIGVCKALLRHPTIKQEEIQSLFKYAYRTFYFRPGQPLRSFKKAISNPGLYYKISKRLLKIFLLNQN